MLSRDGGFSIDQNCPQEWLRLQGFYEHNFCDHYPPCQDVVPIMCWHL